MSFYVYQLVDPRCNQPFYVGKGSGDRKDKHVQKVRLGMVSENRYKDKVIRDIYKETGRYPESVIVAMFEDENEAYEYETALIEKHGTYKEGGILTNILKENAPPSHKGKKRSAETRAKLADRCGEKNPMWGRKHADATKQKWKYRKNPYTGKCGNQHPITGFKHSEIECKRRSQKMKDQWMDAEFAEKTVKNLDRSKVWQVVDPLGNQLIVKNLRKFADEVNTPYHQIRRGNKGWQCNEVK